VIDIQPAYLVVVVQVLGVVFFLFQPVPRALRDFVPGAFDHPGAAQLGLDLVFFGAVEHRGNRPETEPVSRPPQVGFEHLADIHTARHAQRVQDDLDWRAIFEERHILDRHDLRDDTFVAVTPGHLVALGELALLSHADAHHLVDAGGQVAMFFAVEDLDIHHFALFAVRQAQ